MTKQYFGLLALLISPLLTPLNAQTITSKSVPQAAKQTAVDNAQLANQWFERGETKYQLKNFAAAILDYDQAIERMPNHAYAYSQRGNAQYNLGWYKEAIANYDTAILYKSDYASVFNSRGVAKRNLGLYQEAIADYNEAIRLKPNYAVAFNSRGSAKVALKLYDAALLDYEKAIKLNPTYAKAYANKGCCLVQIPDKTAWTEALIWLDKGLILDGLLNYAKDCKAEALRKLKE